jgi:hypothetical protein
MEAGSFDQEAFFTAIERSGARALLIGRQAMVAYGIPVLTADYDVWLHFDDIETLNGALSTLELYPNRTPAEARTRGRYVLEGEEHVDAMVARAGTTKDTGETLRFDEAWARRRSLPYGQSSVAVPEVDDLMKTKAWAMRPKDIQDIRLLAAIRGKGA